MSFTRTSGPTGGRTLGDHSALTKRLETAAQAGTSPSMRRKLLLEAAAFIRLRVVSGAALREAAE